MYHYKARIYSPTLGRFLQTDPVGWDDQINLYAYVGNDPMNFNDASGEGRLRWFVEAATEVYKEVSEKVARRYAKNGRNIEIKGKGSGRTARQVGRDSFGGRSNTKRDGPNEHVPGDKKGNHQEHVQPKDRSTGGDNHIFIGSVVAAITTAIEVIDEFDPLTVKSTTACDTVGSCGRKAPTAKDLQDYQEELDDMDDSERVRL